VQVGTSGHHWVHRVFLLDPEVNEHRAFVLARFAGLWFQGQIALVVKPGLHTFLFWIETVLLLAAGTTFLRGRAFEDLALQLQGSFLALAGAGMYRIDTYLVAYQPAPGWRYFPWVREMLFSACLAAIGVAVYAAFVKLFPILSGVRERRVAAPEPARAVGMRAAAGR
jgi:Ni/Fe-hydrogenase subunit HybB-like protein